MKMTMHDVEKIVFLTPCGVYCYTCMPFGQCNAGATFQQLMHIALGTQLGRNAEAYVDDIVVKSWEAGTLIGDVCQLAQGGPAAQSQEVCIWGPLWQAAGLPGVA